MPITSFERASDINFPDAGGMEESTHVYMVKFDAPPDDAKAECVQFLKDNPGTVPNDHLGLPRQDIRVAYATTDVCTATVEYAADTGSSGVSLVPDDDDSVSVEYSFTSNLENILIRNAENQEAFGLGGPPLLQPRDVGNLINVVWDDEGVPEVKGLQGREPVHGFRLKAEANGLFFTPARKRQWETLVGHVNDQEWNTYQKGELRLLGMTGSIVTSDAKVRSTLTLSFGFKESIIIEAPVTVSRTINGIDITRNSYGWEQVWTDSFSRVNVANETIDAGTRGVYLLQGRWKFKDFANELGIPDGAF